MTDIHKKVAKYAKSVNWDVKLIEDFLESMPYIEWHQIEGCFTDEKVRTIIYKYKPIGCMNDRIKNEPIKVKVVKLGSKSLALASEDGNLIGTRQMDLKISSDVGMNGYVTVSVDFKIPVSEFKIHEQEDNHLEVANADSTIRTWDIHFPPLEPFT